MQQQDNLTINLTVPTRWNLLDDSQLRYLFGLLAQGFPAPQVNAAIAALDRIDNLPLTPVRISRLGKHRALCKFKDEKRLDLRYLGYLCVD